MTWHATRVLAHLCSCVSLSQVLQNDMIQPRCVLSTLWVCTGADKCRVWVLYCFQGQRLLHVSGLPTANTTLGEWTGD
jgi:hypothetical protein